MIGFIADAFYLGALGLWHSLSYLPWPHWDELFKSLVVFVFLWKPRKWLERYWLGKPLYKRRSKSPTTTDHQTAVSAIDNLFHH